MHITRLQLSNVKRISAVTISPDPEGNMVVIGGENGQGKSSILDAIAMTLAGDRCPMPIRRGEKSGKSVIDLGEIIVTRTFTESGGTLKVTNKEGASFPSPQAMLDKLIGPISFDPLAFTQQKPKEQLETLRRLVGVDTSDLDRQYAEHFSERTELNRQVKAVETLVQSKLTAIGDRPEPEGETDTAKLMLELNALQSANRAVEAILRQVERTRADLEHTKGRRLDADVALQKARRALQGAEKELADLDKFVQRDADAHTAAETAARGLEVQDTQPAEDRIAAAGDAKELQKMHADLRATQSTLMQLQADVDQQTVWLGTCERQKRTLIQEAKYPVEGLELGDGGILYDGVPFEQASAAEKLRVSMGMAVAMNPKIPVCLIRDGSLLDKKSLALIAEMAAASGSQVWLERVSDGAECTVIIEDGAVKETRPAK